MNYDKAIQKYKSLLNAHRGIKEGSGMLQMGVRTHSTDSILGTEGNKNFVQTQQEVLRLLLKYSAHFSDGTLPGIIYIPVGRGPR